jgi:hypothetical protein
MKMNDGKKISSIKTSPPIPIEHYERHWWVEQWNSRNSLGKTCFLKPTPIIHNTSGSYNILKNTKSMFSTIFN